MKKFTEFLNESKSNIINNTEEFIDFMENLTKFPDKIQLKYKNQVLNLKNERVKDEKVFCLSEHYSNLVEHDDSDKQINPISTWNGGNCKYCYLIEK